MLFEDNRLRYHHELLKVLLDKKEMGQEGWE
jgi:hypothetical protein